MEKKSLKRWLLNNYIKIFMWVLLGIECIGVFYANLSFSKNNIDCDSAKLFVHAIEMARNKTYLVPNWSYITTLELDCSTLLAVPFFELFGDIYIAFSLSNCIFMFLFLWTIFYLFKDENKLIPLLAAMFLLIPYRIGMLDYFNMMFFNGAQYIIKVTLPLMLVGILCRHITMGSYRWTFEDISFAIIYVLLLFITGFSSGIYVLLCGIFPIIFFGFVKSIYNQEKIQLKFWLWSVLSVAISLVGIICNVAMNINAKGNSMTLCNVYEWKDNISACIIGIYELFGGISNEAVEVLSYEGINILIRMFFVSAILISCVYAFYKFLQHKANNLTVALVGIFVWNLFILCVCDIRYGSPTFEYRYHLMGMVPAICIFVHSILHFLMARTDCRIYGSVVIVLLLLSFNITSYKSVSENINDYSEFQEICDFSNDVGAQYVYFLYESVPPEICRLLDYENVVYLQSMSYGSTVCDYYTYYNQAPILDEDVLLINNNNTYDYGEQLEMYGKIYYRCATIGSRSIYR